MSDQTLQDTAFDKALKFVTRTNTFSEMPVWLRNCKNFIHVIPQDKTNCSFNHNAHQTEKAIDSLLPFKRFL